MVNTLSGSVSAYRKEIVKPRFIRIDEVMALLDVTRDEAMDIALAAGARYQLAKIILVHKERLMKFMKHFARVPSSNKIVEKKFVRIGEASKTYSMRKLLLKGGDLQVLQFNTEDMKKVEKMAKKYGILYSVLPDCNRKDGLSEVIFHTEAVPRVNMMIQKLKFGKIATFDDYLKNGDEKSLGKLMDFLKKQQGNEKSHTIEGDRVNTAIDGLIEKVGMFAMEKKAISVDQVKENFSINGEQAESVIRQLETIGVLGRKNEDGTHTVMMDKDAFINRVRGYQDLAERMRAVAASKNANLSDVTISKKLIIEENDHAVKTRVPGTWGEEARYVWLRKENIMEIHGGKTMLTFLDSTKDYKLYDEQNRVVTTQKGTELYTHYDKVESSVRERYEKVQKQQKKTAQKKTVTTSLTIKSQV